MDLRRLESVREVIASTLEDLGMPEADWSLVTETNPHRDRDHIARLAEGEHVRAIWLVPSRAVEFYGEDGALLKRVALGNELTDRLEAA